MSTSSSFWQVCETPCCLFQPIHAGTWTLTEVHKPSAFDCVRFGFVRAGSAELLGEFGTERVEAGEVFLLGPSLLCGAAPGTSGFVCTIVSLDLDYALDHLFWQYSAQLSDRHDAMEFAALLYPSSFRITRLRTSHFKQLLPRLDRLVELSASGRFTERFNQIQSLWFWIADALTPYLPAAQVHDQAPPAHNRSSARLVRRFAPLRADAQAAANLLRQDFSRQWTLEELANEVHLSKSHLRTVFVEAFGQTPREYLATVRAERMAKLLRETCLPVETIMRMVGWHSRTHTARAFRQLMGLNPGEYRRLRAHVMNPDAHS